MTPQPLPPPPVGPPQQQNFFAKHWPWLVGAGCLLFMCCAFAGLLSMGVLASAAESGGLDAPPAAAADLSARVDCGTPGPDGVDCIVKRTAGSGALEACWQLEIVCANGGVMNGSACGSLAANAQRATVNMPVDAFSNQEGCDAPKSGTVNDLTVTAQ